MATNLQNAIVAAGISRMVINSGSAKKGVQVTLKLKVTDVPDASHMAIYRYGYRKVNDMINSAWAKLPDLVKKGEAKDMEEIDFRRDAMEGIEKAMLSGDWTTSHRTGLTYETKAARIELSAWLIHDGMHAKAVKALETKDDELWRTVTRRSWVNLARKSGMDEKEINEQAAKKAEEKLSACEQAFAATIKARAEKLKAAAEGTKETVALSGMTL